MQKITSQQNQLPPFYPTKPPPSEHKGDEEKHARAHIGRAIPEYIEVSRDKRPHNISKTHHGGIGPESLPHLLSGIVRMQGADRRIDTSVSDRKAGDEDEYSEYKRIEGKKSERDGQDKESEKDHPFLVEKFTSIPDEISLVYDGDNPDKTETVPNEPFIEREAIGENQGEGRLHGREPESDYEGHDE